MNLELNCGFDAGNIEVVDTSNPGNIHLCIRADNAAEFRQWFHFRISGAAGQALRLSIDNAGECSYAEGWHNYQCVASYDRREWFRLPATYYDGERLVIEITPQRDLVWLAYFEPYSMERHQDWLAHCAGLPWARVRCLGTSVQGRALDMVEVGADVGGKPPVVWVVARQHPGEAMAEWFAEGLLERLLDGADPIARELRDCARICVVPNINPDGSVLGNLRSNAAGANLNREWIEPDLVRSPEIFHLQQAMERSGVQLFLDIHGDETLPYVFVDGSQMVPGYGERNVMLQAAFVDALRGASPDFQTIHGYAEDRFHAELLALGSKWVAHRHRCVSLTLEMPFKDSAITPDLRHGWSGARSRALGAAMLQPILAHVRRLRAGV